MAEMLQIRSWRAYWNDYIIKGIQDHVSPGDIRKNILDAMRKEVFGQLMFRCKVSDIKDIQENDENARIVESIAKNTRDKLFALIRHCRGFVETKDILHENDFKELTPFNEEEPEEEEDDGIEFTEQTAEWPELSEETREKNTHDSEGENSSNQNF